MTQLKENKSKIWFKVLQASGLPIDGSSEWWTLTKGDQKGALITYPGEPLRKPDSKGGWYVDPTYRELSWLVSDPSKVYALNSGLKIYVAQALESPIYEAPQMIWVNRACLLREATNLDLKPFGIHRAFTYPSLA